MANEPGQPIIGTPYHVHPSYAMEVTSNTKLIERTGRSLKEWAEFLKSDGPADPKEQKIWLKDVHGITTNYAMWIMENAIGSGGVENYRPVEMVKSMYSGGKAGLLPIYVAILEFGKGVGPDIIVCPCSTMVPFYRKHVFAQVKPTNKTRIDLGFALKGEPFTDRLLDTGGTEKKDRITHRVAISSLADFNDEARDWFRLAYDRCNE